MLYILILIKILIKIQITTYASSKKEWEEIISSLGISNDDKIVIYDNSDLISSCRLWYSFLYFGHNKNLVYVLNGGLEKVE